MSSTWSKDKRFAAIVCAVLSIAVLAIYAQTFSYDFVAYDDDQYVFENPMVRAGLSAAGVHWALTTFHYANWHPLTWISYMLDVQIFGFHSGVEHAVNAALHLASTLLLFWTLLGMTRQPWRCALVAGIFGLHPLHVESVAWVAERKDVLSTFFAMVMLFCYGRYVQRPSVSRYILVAVSFALSLMAKPMSVTWPFVLVLLDYWPFGRFRWPVNSTKFGRLLLEKVPLLVLTVIASVLTFAAQKNYGAVVKLESLPLSSRLANAAVAYLSYVAKSIWPENLAAFYPPQTYDSGTVLMCVVILLAITLVAVKWATTRPYLLVGWFWYLGMLVPVIGIVQVGSQSMADRYTYVPLVGLSIAIIWTVADSLQTKPFLQRCAVAASIVVLLIFTAIAFKATQYWSDSKSLFERALAVTDRNHIMDNNLGVLLANEGRVSEAMKLYRDAIAISPGFADAHANLGHELLKAGQMNEASTQLLEAVRLSPNSAIAQADLGLLLAAEGKLDEAQPHLEESLRQAPNRVETQSNLCYVLQRRGRIEEAIAHCQEALKLKPDSSDARYNLATAFASQGKRDQAVQELNQLLQQNPNNAGARAALSGLQ